MLQLQLPSPFQLRTPRDCFARATFPNYCGVKKSLPRPPSSSGCGMAQTKVSRAFKVRVTYLESRGQTLPELPAATEQAFSTLESWLQWKADSTDRQGQLSNFIWKVRSEESHHIGKLRFLNESMPAGFCLQRSTGKPHHRQSCHNTRSVAHYTKPAGWSFYLLLLSCSGFPPSSISHYQDDDMKHGRSHPLSDNSQHPEALRPRWHEVGQLWSHVAKGWIKKFPNLMRLDKARQRGEKNTLPHTSAINNQIIVSKILKYRDKRLKRGLLDWKSNLIKPVKVILILVW